MAKKTKVRVISRYIDLTLDATCEVGDTLEYSKAKAMDLYKRGLVEVLKVEKKKRKSKK